VNTRRILLLVVLTLTITSFTGCTKSSTDSSATSMSEVTTTTGEQTPTDRLAENIRESCSTIVGSPMMSDTSRVLDSAMTFGKSLNLDVSLITWQVKVYCPAVADLLPTTTTSTAPKPPTYDWYYSKLSFYVPTTKLDKMASSAASENWLEYSNACTGINATGVRILVPTPSDPDGANAFRMLLSNLDQIGSLCNQALMSRPMDVRSWTYETMNSKAPQFDKTEQIRAEIMQILASFH